MASHYALVGRASAGPWHRAGFRFELPGAAGREPGRRPLSQALALPRRGGVAIAPGSPRRQAAAGIEPLRDRAQARAGDGPRNLPPLPWLAGRHKLAPLLWLAAFAAALWPHWRWAAARLADGSDDPLGVAALAMLLVVVARHAPRLRVEPVPARLALAIALAAAATVLGALAPPLAAALLAALALAACLAAFVPPATPLLPLAGLAALALPLVSSLQFYAGFPLRVVTAEASRWLLSGFGFVASREGSTMRVDGLLVIVDAPCSGVQMVWMAYFCACAIAAWRGLPDRQVLKRLAWVGALVLLGNVVRNSILVGLEASGQAPSQALHQAVGFVVLGAVCGAVALLFGRAAAPPPVDAGSAPARDRPFACVPPVALAAFLIACAVAPLAVKGAAAGGTAAGSVSEPPRQWNGRALRPLALGAVEARFAAEFPGRIERLTDERSVFVWREVLAPTRMLHPAADCYRGLGWAIRDARLERDAEARIWRCFSAVRDGRTLRVCERIEDATGIAFSDASSWFWAARLGRSTGPWQALTIATPIGASS